VVALKMNILIINFGMKICPKTSHHENGLFVNFIEVTKSTRIGSCQRLLGTDVFSDVGLESIL
jgi:hypothetical protein